MAVKGQNENRLKKPCRRCEYRRQAYNDAYYHGDSRFSSRCAYLEITNEIRGCTPTDEHCDKFKPRKRARKVG